MKTKTIEYRGYLLIIQPPKSPDSLWHILVWPPRKGAPPVMSAHESEENAIQDAKNAVDRLLGAQNTPAADE
jgi:hypothetical protein